MTEKITNAGEDTIAVSWGRIGRRLLAILLIVLGISILVLSFLHFRH